VAELVERYVKGQRTYEDTPVPGCAQDWLDAQMKDDECRSRLEAIGDEEDVIIPLDGLTAQMTEKYLYRSRIITTNADGIVVNNKAGPLMRSVIKERNLETRHTALRLKHEYKQVVVPKSLVDKMIWILHDQMGHPGKTRTVETAKTRYYWTGMYTNIHKHCKECRFCILKKANNMQTKIPIMSYDFGSRAFDRVQMDLAGPFVSSNSNDTYILVVKDALTKYMLIAPISGKHMFTVQDIYAERWAAMFGPPSLLITDRGTEFHNTTARQLAELWGVKKVIITARNPRANGQVENSMRVIKDMLNAYVKDNQQDWNEHLPQIAQMYNSTVNSATGMTPFYLVYGTEMNMANQSRAH